jgi:hypothetical protein
MGDLACRDLRVKKEIAVAVVENAFQAQKERKATEDSTADQELLGRKETSVPLVFLANLATMAYPDHPDNLAFRAIQDNLGCRDHRVAKEILQGRNRSSVNRVPEGQKETQAYRGCLEKRAFPAFPANRDKMEDLALKEPRANPVSLVGRANPVKMDYQESRDRKATPESASPANRELEAKRVNLEFLALLDEQAKKEILDHHRKKTN